ncbi:MAG: phosphotransferase [Planctomycetota bacterium]
MESPQVTHELKNDMMGLVERVDGPSGPVVRRVAKGGSIPGTRLVARVLMGRERRALERLADVTGVARLVEDEAYASAPSLGGGPPRRKDVLMRSWVDGNPLQQADELPENFFELLEDLVRELHRRGVCHNDLHKEANILVGEDGYPALVDFQLASVHEREDRGYGVRVREDLRHVKKHRWKYTSRGGAAAEAATAAGEVRPSKKRSFLAHAWLRFGKPPYLFVTRKVIGYKGGERGRPKTGPWPEWTAPLAPRERSTTPA